MPLAPGGRRPFRPDRSQRRTRKANEGAVHLRIGTPTVTAEKVALFDRFHADRSQTRGWPSHEPDDAGEYATNFVSNPFPTQEWCYFLDDSLVGVGYVDDLVGGLSAIYFAHDPRSRDRSLGTWNVLNLIDRATALVCPTSTSAICRGLSFAAIQGEVPTEPEPRPRWTLAQKARR